MYASVLFSDLITALAVRLSDPNFEFWTQREITAYLKEALRTWAAFSATYNVRVPLSTAASTLFYDLFSLVPELTPTILDQELVQDVAFALQEPYDFVTNQWIGTDQFSVDDVYQSLNQRRNRFLLETGMVLSNVQVPGPTPSTSTLTLPQNVIDVRQMLWKDSAYSLMWRFDTFTQGTNPFGSLTPDIPIDYITYPNQPLVVTLSPPPANAGLVNMLVVQSIPNLDPNTPTLIGIPDNFCWVLKYGILADLYATDGQGQDDARAAYCEQRWAEGIKLARISNMVHIGYNTGLPYFLDSLFELNTGDPSWCSRTPGAPETIAIAGNIVAVGPTSDVPYTILLDVTPNFPIDTATYVQIGPEVVSTILDLSQHLADLKEGAEEVQSSARQYHNMVKVAAVQNDRLRAQAQNFDALNTKTKRFNKEHLRRVSQLGLKELDYAQE